MTYWIDEDKLQRAIRYAVTETFRSELTRQIQLQNPSSTIHFDHLSVSMNFDTPNIKIDGRPVIYKMPEPVGLVQRAKRLRDTL